MGSGKYACERLLGILAIYGGWKVYGMVMVIQSAASSFSVKYI
jgi:hypothetical protein